jgi:hypothetical protein
VKKVTIIAVSILIFAAVQTASLAGGCGSSVPSGYHISFSLEDQNYTWTLGVTSVEEDALGELLSEGAFLAMATPETITDTQEFYDCSNYIALIIISGDITAGTYPCDSNDTRLKIKIENAYYELVSGTITIEKIGAYGETITGTFQGSVEPSGGGEPLELSPGSFRVQRIPDDVWIPDL